MPRPARRPHSPVFTRGVALGAAAALSLCAACAPVRQSNIDRGDRDRRDPGVREVRVGGDADLLGERTANAITPAALIQDVRALLADNRRRSAALLVATYPDVAVQALREMESPDAASSASADLLAAVVDALMSPGGNPAGGWSAVLAERAFAPQTFARYDEARRAVAADLRRGLFDRAAASTLADELPPGAPALLVAEAQQLAGIASLLAGQPAEAADRFGRGVAALPTDAAVARAELLLLRSEAFARSGRLSEAASAWRDAVVAAGDALPEVPGPAALVPGLWERLAQAKPIDAQWPAPTLDGVVRALALAPGALALRDAPPGQPAIAALMGVWRLMREEAQVALLALKQAEVRINDNAVVPQLRYLQARAMLALRRPDAANAALLQLIEREPADVARAATMTLGVIDLRAGRLQQGVALLQRAVSDGLDETWPGRASAEADLALAMLAAGEEESAMALLDRARAAFRAERRDADLLRSLRNEAAYLRRIGEDERLEAVIGELLSIEASPGIVR